MKISGIFFAIVIIAFLLPFMVVKCGDTKIASFSGFKLVTGGKVETPAMDNMMQGLGDAFKSAGDLAGTEEAEETKEAKAEKVKPNFFAIIALLAAIVGLVTAFVMDQKKYILPLVMGVVGFIALLLIRSGLSSSWAADSKELAGMIKVNLQFGYFLALLAFIGAAVFAWLAGKNKSAMVEQRISDMIPDKVEDTFDKAKDTVTAAGAAAWDKVEDTVDKVKDKIEDAKLDEKIEDAVDKAKDFIKGDDNKEQ